MEQLMSSKNSADVKVDFLIDAVHTVIQVRDTVDRSINPLNLLPHDQMLLLIARFSDPTS
jgi:hypothetical protein